MKILVNDTIKIKKSRKRNKKVTMYEYGLEIPEAEKCYPLCDQFNLGFQDINNWYDS